MTVAALKHIGSLLKKHKDKVEGPLLEGLKAEDEAAQLAHAAVLLNLDGRYAEAALAWFKKSIEIGGVETRRKIVEWMGRWGEEGLVILVKAAADKDKTVSEPAMLYLQIASGEDFTTPGTWKIWHNRRMKKNKPKKEDKPEPEAPVKQKPSVEKKPAVPLTPRALVPID